jgi:hypothetical protein
LLVFSVGNAASPEKEEAKQLTPASAVSPEPEEDYKVTRLREFAALWKGTVLEPHTVRLLAMLMQEDGTITAERRHDCAGSQCWAVGIMGHHICARGTPLIYVTTGEEQKLFCTPWVDRKTAMQRFEEAYPVFAFDYREQFREYTYRMTTCINEGHTANQCVQNWNPNETGRITKVKSREAVVREALGV